jgi:hypothetical protein
MSEALRWAGQAVLYGAFALFVGVFSHWPRYEALAPGDALLKVSFIHHGQRIAECRPQTPEERAKLPPTMRAPMKGARERSPVTIEVELDGRPVYRHVAEPAGLSRDGASAVYYRMPVPAGEHRIAVRLKDSAAPNAPVYTKEATLTLKPSQVLVIDFDAAKGGVTLS